MNITRKQQKEHKDALSRLSLMDDAFMAKCFEDNITCTELVISIILDRSDIRVKSVHTQHQLKNLQGRSAILDIYAEDEDGKVYDIEIQKAKEGATPKRARYYSSLMDANITEPGDDFEKLRESYVIFITETDVLKNGKAIYHIERYIEEASERFKDGAHIIYVNGDNRDGSPLGLLMQDLRCSDPDRMNYKELSERTRYFKEDKEGMKRMGSVIDELIQEGKMEGLKEGKLEAAQSTACKLLKSGKFSVKEIAEYVSLPVEEIEELAKKGDGHIC